VSGRGARSTACAGARARAARLRCCQRQVKQQQTAKSGHLSFGWCSWFLALFPVLMIVQVGAAIRDHFFYSEI